MAKLLQIGKNIINVENVEYFDLGDDEHSTITVHFGSQMSLQFTGEDASLLWELLETEIFCSGISNPTD